MRLGQETFAYHREQAQARGALHQALQAAQAIRDANDRAKVPVAQALAAVAQALAQVTRGEDAEVARRTAEAFRWARARGREEVWQHIEAFAPVLGKLGVIGGVWARVSAVESLHR